MRKIVADVGIIAFLSGQGLFAAEALKSQSSQTDYWLADTSYHQTAG